MRGSRGDIDSLRVFSSSSSSASLAVVSGRVVSAHGRGRRRGAERAAQCLPRLAHDHRHRTRALGGEAGEVVAGHRSDSLHVQAREEGLGLCASHLGEHGECERSPLLQRSGRSFRLPRDSRPHRISSLHRCEARRGGDACELQEPREAQARGATGQRLEHALREGGRLEAHDRSQVLGRQAPVALTLRAQRGEQVELLPRVGHGDGHLLVQAVHLHQAAVERELELVGNVLQRHVLVREARRRHPERVRHDRPHVLREHRRVFLLQLVREVGRQVGHLQLVPQVAAEAHAEGQDLRPAPHVAGVEVSAVVAHHARLQRHAGLEGAGAEGEEG
mmetsp:Transcript_14744/g.47029  ORF Transcript_14744/g.47029 Transcript_14744/m.47029 type:complete len:333 (-) Transcript_14744:117-1115(-)